MELFFGLLEVSFTFMFADYIVWWYPVLEILFCLDVVCRWLEVGGTRVMHGTGGEPCWTLLCLA